MAKAMRDTIFGFTGTEIGQLLLQCYFIDTDLTITKYKHLYNSFCGSYNKEHSVHAVYIFNQVAQGNAGWILSVMPDADRQVWR